MGDAFDVVGKRKQMDYKILSRNALQRFNTEQEWQITLSNHKEKPAEIEVIEPVPGDWKVIRSSHDYKKEDAGAIKFKLKLAKDETQTITYRVKIRYW